MLCRPLLFSPFVQVAINEAHRKRVFVASLSRNRSGNTRRGSLAQQESAPQTLTPSRRSRFRRASTRLPHSSSDWASPASRCSSALAVASKFRRCKRSGCASSRSFTARWLFAFNSLLSLLMSWLYTSESWHLWRAVRRQRQRVILLLCLLDLLPENVVLLKTVDILVEKVGKLVIDASELALKSVPQLVLLPASLAFSLVNGRLRGASGPLLCWASF